MIDFMGNVIQYTNLCLKIDPSDTFQCRRWTMRVKITLACQECKSRNYNTTKNKKNDPDRIELKKYCRFCKTHTAHKETK